MAGNIAGHIENGAHPEGVRMIYEYESEPFRDPASGPLMPSWGKMLDRCCQMFPDFAERLPALLEEGRHVPIPGIVYRLCDIDEPDRESLSTLRR
jgi:hypothetical protein